MPLALALALIFLPGRLPAATNTVTTLADSGAGSLRQVVLASMPGDTIRFAMESGVVTLLEPVTIDKHLALSGPGTNLAINGNHGTRLFQITAETTVSISGLTLRQGKAPDGEDGTANPATAGAPGGSGGAIHTAGTLCLADCTLQNNSAGRGGTGADASIAGPTPGGAGGSGGAIYNTGALTVSNCAFLMNAGGAGGAGGSAPTFSASSGSGGNGGAVCSSGPLELRNAAFRSNQAGIGASALRERAGALGGSGGAVWCAGWLVASDCVFVENGTGIGGGGGADSLIAGGGGAGGSGGGIWAGGVVLLTQSTLSSNTCASGGPGGNIYGASIGDSGPGGSAGSGCGLCCTNAALLVRCTVSGNRGSRGGTGGGGENGAWGGQGSCGAGIYAVGRLSLEGCTVSDNLCGNGGDGGSGRAYPSPYGGGGGLSGSGGAGGSGGIMARGSLVLTNCTVSGNRSGNGGAAGTGYYPVGTGGNGGSGGGIYWYGQSTGALTSCTLAGNRAGLAGTGPGGQVGTGGGIYASSTGPLECLNTLTAGNFGTAPDVAGQVASLGWNLVGVTNGSSGFNVGSDRVGSIDAPIDPQTGPLDDYGGPTRTVALLAGSPALDAGTTTGVPPTDQRGVSRPQGEGIDIGAFEYKYNTPVVGDAGIQDGYFRLHGCGLPAREYEIQVSCDLLEWAGAGSCTSSACGLFDYLDPAPADGEKRFYRLRQIGP